MPVVPGQQYSFDAQKTCDAMAVRGGVDEALWVQDGLAEHTAAWEEGSTRLPALLFV